MLLLLTVIWWPALMLHVQPNYSIKETLDYYVNSLSSRIYLTGNNTV